MMFFKAVFALYLAAIALAAPGGGEGWGGEGDGGEGHRGEGHGGDVNGIRKLLLNPCSLCTSLSTTVEVDHDNIGNGDLNHVHVG